MELSWLRTAGSTAEKMASAAPQREQSHHNEGCAFFFRFLLDSKAGVRNHCPHLLDEKAVDTGKLPVLKELSLEPLEDLNPKFLLDELTKDKKCNHQHNSVLYTNT